MTELDVARSRVAPEFLIQWVSILCQETYCPAPHLMCLLGFKLGPTPEMNWFFPVSNVFGIEDELTEAVIESTEDELLRKTDEQIDNYRKVAAAFGVEWSALSRKRIWQQYRAIGSLGSVVAAEMHEQGVEGLLELRKWMGRRRTATMANFLPALAEYRSNVGGTYVEERAA